MSKKIFGLLYEYTRLLTKMYVHPPNTPPRGHIVISVKSTAVYNEIL